MNATSNIVRSIVGRRHKISRQEMMDILLAIPMDIVNASTIGNGRGKDGRLYVAGKWIEDRADEPRAVARAWANMCTSITCISVLQSSYYRDETLTEGLGVRYDEPGSMHPMQRSEIIFAPAELEGCEYDQIGQLRRRADRVLVVAGDPPLVESARESIRRKVDAWARERNTCEEDRILDVDSRHAYRCGLMLLSQLLRLRADLERAKAELLAPEAVAHLTPIIMLARGEAQDRLRAQVQDEMIEIPGIVSHAYAHEDDE